MRVHTCHVEVCSLCEEVQDGCATVVLYLTLTIRLPILGGVILLGLALNSLAFSLPRASSSKFFIFFNHYHQYHHYHTTNSDFQFHQSDRMGQIYSLAAVVGGSSPPAHASSLFLLVFSHSEKLASCEPISSSLTIRNYTLVL